MTTSIRTLLPMASTGCSCCAPGAIDTSTAPDGKPSVTYAVEGMTCGHCAGRVTEALSALEGAGEVQVELVPGGVSAVTVTGAGLSPAQVRGAVEQAGYTLVAP